jgi:intraflagellar transport protein 172
MNAEELIDNKGADLDEAAKLLRARPGPATESAMPVYRRLVRHLMMRTKDAETAPGVDHPGAIAALREVLYRLGSRKQEVEELLMATHYQHMYFQATQLGLKDIAAKCAITLLKYPTIIPHDKAFYQAGQACKELGITNLAFVLLNRYIDLTEAIDTGDSSFMDSSDYHDADAIPLNAPIPPNHYLLDEDDREHVRTWVLSIITDSSIDQRIPPREDSRNTLYEAFFSVDRPTCIVTGYPVYPADMLEVNNSIANRKDWNAIVSKTRTCPWTGLENQRPLY